MEKENPQPSRMERAVLHDETAAKIRRIESVTALFGGFAIVAAGLSSRTRKPDATYDQEAESHLIDNTHVLGNDKKLRNFGVLHTDRQFEIHREYLETAIQECDVLLIEESEGPFFGPCTDFALGQGKEVVDIDIYKRKQREIAESGLSIGTMALVAEQGYAEWQRKKNNVPLRAFHTRRNIFRVFCGIGAAATAFHGFDNPFAKGNVGFQSFMTRGRTAAMYDESQKIIDEGEGKNYLLITGNGHAEIIEDYFSNPQLLTEDLEKFQTHFNILGRGAEKIPPQ